MRAATVLFDPPLSIAHPRQWSGHPAVNVLSHYLNRHGVAAITVDFNQLFVRQVVSSPYVAQEHAQTTTLIERYESHRHPLSPGELSEYLQLLNYHSLLQALPTGNVEQAERFVAENIAFYRRLIEPVNLIDSTGDCFDENELAGLLEGAHGDRIRELILAGIECCPPVTRTTLVGISVPSCIQLPYALLLGRVVKEAFGATVCIGGSYLSLIADKWLQDWQASGYIDHYIRGPGERKLLALASADICHGVEVRLQAEQPIDIAEQKIGNLSRAQRVVRIPLSHGCYWKQCAYCDYVTVNSRFRIKKVNALVEEIVGYLSNENQLDDLEFHLITDALPPGYAAKLMDHLERRNIGIRWGCSYLRVDRRYDRGLFERMRQSGFNFESVAVGVDSLCDQALTLSNKGYSFSEVKEFFLAADAARVRFGQINLIPDLPGTTSSGADAGLKLLSQFAHLTSSLTNFHFQMTSTSRMGEEPELFGLIPSGARPSHNQFYSNSIAFSDMGGMEKAQATACFNRYRRLAQCIEIARRYPGLGAAELFAHNSYDSDDDPLYLTLPAQAQVRSRYLANGRLASQPLWLPLGNNGMLNDAFLPLWNLLLGLEPGTRLSLGELSERAGFPSRFARDLMLQQIYPAIRTLLASGYFQHATWEAAA